MRTITSAFPWNQVKWRSKEEQRIQTLDLALKILVPLILSACLVIALKVGSFNGYLQLLSRQSFGSPLMALGAGFTLAYLAFQLVRTVLWLRYKAYPLPPGPLPRVTVIIPAYNEGAMVEKSIYAAVASDALPCAPKLAAIPSSAWPRNGFCGCSRRNRSNWVFASAYLPSVKNAPAACNKASAAASVLGYRSTTLR